jgi:hypothetical protein
MARKNLQTRIDKYHQGILCVELGYNFQLQKKKDKAKEFTEQAIDKSGKIRMKFCYFYCF